MILTQSQIELENSLRRILPAGVVSCWIPDGYGGAKDVIGGNHGTCFGTHPNVPVITSDSGLGSLNYDNLSGTFISGEGIVGATSKSSGTIKSDDGSTLELTGCHGRFHDNEQITGSISGATADVNHPDTAVGVDLIQNGEFSVDNDPPNGWPSYRSSLVTTEAGGKIGNCLMIKENGQSSPGTIQNLPLLPGKTYNLKYHFKEGTGPYYRVAVRDQTNGVNLIDTGNLEAGESWDGSSIVFKVPVDCLVVWIYVYHICDEGAGTTSYFDEISLYEVSRYNLINPSVGWVFGGDDYVEIPHDPSLAFTSEDFTAGGYLYISSNGVTSFLMSKGKKEIDGWYIYGTNVNRRLNVRFNQTGTSQTQVSPEGCYDLDSWHCVIVTRSGTAVKIFVDNVDKTSTPATMTDPLATTRALLLATDAGKGSYLVGNVALPFVVKSAWNAAQRSNFYLATKGMFAPIG